MIGTLVFFRHPQRGWVLGKIARVVGDLVVCLDNADGRSAEVPEGEVAVARDDLLGELGGDLSQLPALHPATLVRCATQRFAQGSPFLTIGRNGLLYLHPRGHPTAALSALQWQAAAHLTQAPHWAAAEPPAPDAPAGWWTVGRRALADAMHRGRSVVVSVGEAADGAWMFRLWALRRRAELYEEAQGALRLGAGPEAPPVPANEELYCDLELAEEATQAGLWAAGAAAEHVEQQLVRMGSGAWLSGQTAPKAMRVRALRLAALLADAHCLVSAFAGGGDGRRAQATGDVASATSSGGGPGACRETVVRFSEGGVVADWSMRAWWTGRGPARRPLHCMRVLAHAPRLRSQLLGHHFDTRWHSDQQFVASGAAYECCAALLRRIGLGDASAGAVWDTVAGAMLLAHRCRMVDQFGGAKLRGDTDAVERAARLLGVAEQRLRRALEEPPLSATQGDARKDALCDALLDGALQWLLDHVNSRCQDLAHTDGLELGDPCDWSAVTAVCVPGLARPPPGDARGGVSDLCHNLCVDAIWSLYDAAVFTQPLQDADAEGCPVNPLLDQLRKRPTLQRLNPLVQALSQWDGSAASPPGAASWEWAHATGDRLKYTFDPPPQPPIHAAFSSDGPHEDSFVSSELLPLMSPATEPQRAVAAMAELLESASCSETPQHWIFWVDPMEAPSAPPGAYVDAVPQRGPLKGFSGLRLEAALYANRVVETALLCKLGHPHWWSLRNFTERFRVLSPPDLRRAGPGAAAAAVAARCADALAAADSPQPEGTPDPVEVCRSTVFATPSAVTALERLRGAALNAAAVRLQAVARTTCAKLSLRQFRALLCMRASAVVVGAFAAARASQRVAHRRRFLVAARRIAAEAELCGLRRRLWRSENGVLESPLPYLRLRRLTEAQERQRAEYCERVLCELSRRRRGDLRMALSSCAQARRHFYSLLASELQRELFADEDSLRDLLCLVEARDRRDLELADVVTDLQVAEASARRGVRLMCGDGTRQLLEAFSALFRERLSLGEFIHRRDLQLLYAARRIEVEERIHRAEGLIAERECRTRAEAAFVRAAAAAGGVFCACHGWRLQLEQMGRRRIEEEELAALAGLSGVWCRALPGARERPLRLALEAAESRERAALRRGPAAVELLCASGRRLIHFEELAWAGRLGVGACTLGERARRLILLRGCETAYRRLASLHGLAAAEHAARAGLERERRAAGAALWLAAPHSAEAAERQRRGELAAWEAAARGHMSSAADVAQQEQGARAALAARVAAELRRIQALLEEVDEAARERRRVATALQRRQVARAAASVRSYSPSEFLLSEDPIEQPQPAPAPTAPAAPSTPPPAASSPVGSPTPSPQAPPPAPLEFGSTGTRGAAGAAAPRAAASPSGAAPRGSADEAAPPAPPPEAEPAPAAEPLPPTRELSFSCGGLSRTAGSAGVRPPDPGTTLAASAASLDESFSMLRSLRRSSAPRLRADSSTAPSSCASRRSSGAAAPAASADAAAGAAVANPLTVFTFEEVWQP